MSDKLPTAPHNVKCNTETQILLRDTDRYLLQTLKHNTRKQIKISRSSSLTEIIRVDTV